MFFIPKIYSGIRPEIFSLWIPNSGCIDMFVPFATKYLICDFMNFIEFIITFRMVLQSYGVGPFQRTLETIFFHSKSVVKFNKIHGRKYHFNCGSYGRFRYPNALGASPSKTIISMISNLPLRQALTARSSMGSLLVSLMKSGGVYSNSPVTTSWIQSLLLTLLQINLCVTGLPLGSCANIMPLTTIDGRGCQASSRLNLILAIVFMDSLVGSITITR